MRQGKTMAWSHKQTKEDCKNRPKSRIEKTHKKSQEPNNQNRTRKKNAKVKSLRGQEKQAKVANKNTSKNHV